MSATEPTRPASAPAATGTSLGTYIVRHGVTRMLGEFTAPPGALFLRGSEIVIRTDRGQEIGQVLCAAHPQAVALLVEPTRGEIVRPLTVEDGQRVERLREMQRQEYDIASRAIHSRKLQMELV